VLITLGSLFALFEGYEKLRQPHRIESLGWAFGALLVGLALESWPLDVGDRISFVSSVRSVRSEFVLGGGEVT